jgi:hypothetical protein
MNKLEWEQITDTTHRLKVEGGFLYRCKSNNMCVNFISSPPSICFVPDIDLLKYQSHLRDAYKKGYEAGHYDSKLNINCYE